MKAGMGDLAITLGSVAVVIPLTLLGLAGLRMALGPLPVGSELVLWAFALATCVAAIGLSAWSRRSENAHTTLAGLLGGYAAMAIAGILTLIVWLLVFYAAGSYEKGGYSRLLFGIAALVAITAAALASAARIVAPASARDIPKLVGLVCLVFFSFLSGMVLLPLLPVP